jgi:hypothetical protein
MRCNSVPAFDTSEESQRKRKKWTKPNHENMRLRNWYSSPHESKTCAWPYGCCDRYNKSGRAAQL